MRLTSSPSVSSSTLTGIFPAPKGSVFGCLSFVFRRILCSRTLPTHPFDQFKETDETPKSDLPATPNLVAKLMGLDPTPDSISYEDSTPISRCKSANCKTEKTGGKQGRHRRVKTSVSYTETPSYFEFEEGDFFVLSFENGERNRKLKVRKAKSEMGRRKGDEQRRRRRVQIKERPFLKVSEGADFVAEMGNYDRGISRKKRKEKCCLVEANVGIESDESDHLSPVSVLDYYGLFNGDREEVPSSEEESGSRSSSPSRKLASKLSNLEHSSSSGHNKESCSNGDHDQEPNEEAQVNNQAGLQRKDYHSRQNIEMLNHICRLAESEMADSEWECKNKVIKSLSKWEVEFGAELSLQIVEQLVYEVVHQLF